MTQQENAKETGGGQQYSLQEERREANSVREEDFSLKTKRISFGTKPADHK